jgi:pimeloyl-ACP methyl ester carboxylesterase
MERVAYDEFGLFADNASEFGLPYDGPPTVRREFVAVDDERRLSALVWGSDAPELVFLHGGAQNAHTWDTVAMALGRPLVCIDLPGHGHSDGGRHGQLDLADNAADVAVAIRALAPDAKAVVGMSLGGMTTIALARHAPDLVRAMVLVDITPGVTAEKAKAITDFVNGPASFPSFEELLARTMEHNPTRSEASLRRGILHNAEQREDGSWVWRYARHRQLGPDAEQAPRPETDRSELWDVIAGLTVPLLLVRGMRPQSVVDDGDEAELQRRLPSAQVVHVEEAGHSVQGDTPLELAQIIADFVP